MDTQVVNDVLASYMSAGPWMILLLVWSIAWKLVALWKAAKNNHMTIFIVLGILNTAGIAEIVYLVYLYIKDKKNKLIVK